ncbi:MAG TPA: prepilin-type N-terminal cleavage/methylation domain-containing protein [Opitutaceae bacterium]|nr:prepilin-type N-terminal cleavage/methylation domain-containing protein [Opitutaceae bacterium]
MNTPTVAPLHSVGESHRLRSRRRGMTLVEVMIALFVLLIVFGGVLASIVRAAAMTRDSKIIYRETAIMNDLVERMRSMTFAELKAELKNGNSALGITVDTAKPNTTKGEVPPTTPSGAGTGPVLAGAYTYRWERTCTDLGADPLRIELRTWADSQESRSVTVVTYISASGLINKESK